MQSSPSYYPPSTKWEERVIFTPNQQQLSLSGLERLDLFAYSIEANEETKMQLSKRTYRRLLSKMRTPIERFYPEIWDPSKHELLESLPLYHEPYSNALNVKRLPIQRFEQLSDESHHLVDCDDPVKFFDAIFRQYEFRSILQEMKRYRKQQHLDTPPHNFAVPTYEELRCFVGLLLWTSLVPLPNRRSYLAESEIYFYLNDGQILRAQRDKTIHEV